MRRLKFIILLSLVSLLYSAKAFAEIVYVGIPHTRTIVNDYGESSTEALSQEESLKLKVILTSKNKSLIWKSRKSNKLCGGVSGAYYTFFAENGSGHIRIIPEDIRESLDNLANTATKSAKKMVGYTEVIYNFQGLIIYQGFSAEENLAATVLMNCKAYNPLDKYEQ